MATRRRSFVSLALLLFPFLTHPAGAQTAESFYRGKTIRFIVSSAPGGGFDLVTRLIARHLSKHVPGQPGTMVMNLPGAGGVLANNYVYNVAKPDGLTVGFYNAGLLHLDLIGTPAVEFDSKKLQWIGSAGSDVVLCIARHDSGFKTISDLIGSPKPLIVGSSGRGSNASVYPRAINAVLGTNFKIVEGYPAAAQVRAAIDRSEVDGQCVFWNAIRGTRPDWVAKGFVNVLLQAGFDKHPDFPQVPWLMELAKKPEDRAFLETLVTPSRMAWPFVVSPGVPGDRAKLLRDGFMKTMKDPAFLSEAERAQQEIRPITGEEVQKLVEKVFASPPAVVTRIAEILK
jgi:tripartite-type tricarboxylate transporter receptor subunit TctC